MIQNLGALGSLTSSEVATELNTRGYYLQSATPTPTTLPTITRAQYIDWCVDGSLSYYGFPKVASTSKYFTAYEWKAIVDYAIYISTQLDTQYSILGGLRMSGLRLGITVPATPYEPSWGSVWGPIILQMIGAAATIGGAAWQAKITRDQLEAQYAATTGQTLGVPTQTDLNTMSVQLAKMGYTQAEISTILSKAVPTVQPTGQLPSWALPVGIGALALVLFTQRRG